MSDIAEWSYTATATVWHRTGTDKFGVATFAAPITIACDYGSNQQRNKFEYGREFAVKDILYTAYPDMNIGDFIAIGEFDNPDPFSVGANEVIAIQRFADTFSRQRDDYSVMTGIASGSFR